MLEKIMIIVVLMTGCHQDKKVIKTVRTCVESEFNSVPKKQRDIIDSLEMNIPSLDVLFIGEYEFHFCRNLETNDSEYDLMFCGKEGFCSDCSEVIDGDIKINWK